MPFIDSPFISIIIPAYNAENTIQMTLESVINQTYTNIEIICIDDGSIDKTQDIIKEYASHDERVKLINQRNAGVSVARNTGVSIAQGQYLMFLDSDDWIELNTCEAALNAIRSDNADIVMWPYIREYVTGSNPKALFDSDRHFDTKEACGSLHLQLFGPLGTQLQTPHNVDSIGTVWGKLYRTELLQHEECKFTDLSTIGTFEDGLYNIAVFHYAEKITYINQYLQHYRKGQGQTSFYKPNLKNQWKTLFQIMKSYIHSHNLPPTYMEALHNREAVSVIQLALVIHADHDASIFTRCKRIHELLYDETYSHAVKQLQINEMPIHWKTFFICCKMKLSLPVDILTTCMEKLAKVIK